MVPAQEDTNYILTSIPFPRNSKSVSGLRRS
jgi:hypothetical protein